MPSPLVLVLDHDPSARERAREALVTAGIEAVVVPTAEEALEALSRFRAGGGAEFPRILGRSSASHALRQRVQALAASRAPVLFSGEPGSGRRHAASCLHAMSAEAGSFVVVPTGDVAAISTALERTAGTVFVPSIEQLAWPVQETLAAALTSASHRPRVTASIGVDPGRAVEEGRLSPSLAAAFRGSVVAVPPLRERRLDIAILVSAFIEELRGLNRLPPLAVASDAMAALERFAWPGNVAQLRGAVESAVILAADGTVRLQDLPEPLGLRAIAAVPGGDSPRRFREAKRLVVEAFERSYLEDLLRRHGGNVTGAAEQSGMLRSALQRLLRKHELHSADFRRGDARGPYAT